MYTEAREPNAALSMSSSPETGSGGGGGDAAAPPLEVRARVLCLWNNELRPAEIVERRRVIGGDEKYEYYVHYTDPDGSLDELVKSEQLDLGSEGTDADKQTDDKGREEFDTASLQQGREIIKVKLIAEIKLGTNEIDTLFYSPFPLDGKDTSKQYFCEFCLEFKELKGHLVRHMESCHLRHPPGTEIYQSGNLFVFEVDGEEEKAYSRNLCLLARLFLPSKAPDPEIEHFLFYILCKYDDRGYHMVAYFSKVKDIEQGCNLSCILTFPPFQRKGYGTFLIELSYEFSKREGRAGRPEPPLSKLGLLSYRSYWTRALVNILKEKKETVSLKDLSKATGIAEEDILGTFHGLNLIKHEKGMLVICTDPDVLDRHLKPAGPRDLKLDASKLIWTPYHMRS